MSESVKLSAIDRALAAAKARKAAKEAAGIEPEVTVAPKAKKVPAPKAPKVKAEKLVDPTVLEARAAKAAARAKAAKLAQFEASRARFQVVLRQQGAKAAALAQFEADRAARLSAREAKAAHRAATKAVVAGLAHLKKVDRAMAKLPQLNEEMQKEFNGIISNFGLPQLEVLAMHLQLHTRTEKTLRATKGGPLPLGATVTIIGGDPRFIGKTGTVVTSQKLRATVAVEGAKKPVYIYTSEAKVNG